MALPVSGERIDLPVRLPLLPLRDLVIFPTMSVPLFVNRRGSLGALRAACAADDLALAVTQRAPETPDPTQDDLHEIGCIVRIRQRFELPDGSQRILTEGLARARLVSIERAAGAALALYAPLRERAVRGQAALRLAQEVRERFREYADLSHRVPAEVLMTLREETAAAAVSFRVASHLPGEVAEKLDWLAAPGAEARLMRLRSGLDQRLVALRREALQTRLAEPPGGSPSRRRGGGRWGPGLASGSAESSAEIEALAQQIAAVRMPAAVRTKAEAELARLARMGFGTPEFTVCRSYLEWLIELPWRKRSRDRTDLARARAILEEDHFGLEKVKERVLEQIAVLKLSRRVRGPVLCLTGPPGVGKTSLGRSIARALGRRFVRMSLGGIRDEAEIRGHRRTYVGSLPGRIVQAMRRAGTTNPVILLDEIDKLGADHRGDPAAALLEVLDPEQNHAFNDHYLEVDYDLSRVLFVTTANLLHAIPEPLRDRMEIIRIPGYLEDEQRVIAKRFLLPRQIRACGLAAGDLDLPDETLLRIIREYTREAGVRGLEREIARICRRVAKAQVGGHMADAGATRIAADRLERILGVPQHADWRGDLISRAGVALGLAWTPNGGELLTIEAGVLAGRGHLILTGKLGETMRESAQAALSYVRSRAERFGLAPDFYREVDIHIHVPEGAIPKDGPSAGVPIALAMISALTGIATRAATAMTGEITLRGCVLPVGGLGEKLVAARRAGLDTVLFPQANRPHLAELPAELQSDLALIPIETMDEAVARGLERCPARRDRAAHEIERISSGRGSAFTARLRPAA